MSRTYDVVLYGATGFTGRQAARYFAQHAPAGLRWAVAGRDAARLAEVQAETGAPGRLVADALDAVAVGDMVAQARVVLSTAGPFARYGDAVVAACVDHRTDYVDITGETPWVRRLIDRHHAQAAADGTRIVPCCGFDSVPSDLGALAMVAHLRDTADQPTRSVMAEFRARGGFNGGTLASVLALGEDGGLAAVADPLLLNPADHQTDAERARSADWRAVRRDPETGRYRVPFLMAPVNTRVVRRSNALQAQLTGEAYGPTFRYQEVMSVSGRGAAWATGLGLAAFERLAGWRWGRGLMRRLGPAPGEGPDEATMDGGFVKVRYRAEAEDGRVAIGRLVAQGDPGNRVTVAMLCEAALLLATARETLPGGGARGGVLTPATALGLPLLERLRGRGFEWSIEDASAAC